MDCCCLHLALRHSLRLFVSVHYAFLIHNIANFELLNRWGPVAWIIISEVFPLGLRAKGVSLGGSSNWLNNVRTKPRARCIECMLTNQLVRRRHVHLRLHRNISVRSIRESSLVIRFNA
jgi:hypothetical protein